MNRPRWLFVVLPTALALIHALFRFRPYRDRLIGWGDDPALQLWIFEQNWKHIRQHGSWAIFTEPFWKTNIFHPFPLNLATTDNELYAALVSWPIRLATDNGALAMGSLAFVMILAAFVFAALWLRSIGVKQLYVWGGLLFAGCGWIQSQYAHYQNICIFVFPLALWLWARFLARPDIPRMLACGLAFGWIIGWNVYYQVFANVVLSCLILYTSLTRKELRLKCVTLLVTVALVELPMVGRYFQVEAWMGSLSAGLDQFRAVSAKPWSFLAQTTPQSLLSTLLPVYPKPNRLIERAGFLGFTWAALIGFIVIGTRERLPRVLAAVSLIVYWFSLGPDYGLFHFLRPFPGVSGVRAIGRLQLLVALVSLPALLLFLETRKAWVKHGLLALIVLELVPGERVAHVSIPETFFHQPSEFSARLNQDATGAPILFVPWHNSRYQLYALQTEQPLVNGYSGRTPASALFVASLLSTGVYDKASVERITGVTGAALWASVDPALTARLATSNVFQSKGCYRHFELTACLFAPRDARAP